MAKDLKAIAEGIENTRSALNRVELLASLGWTLPMSMTPGQFNSLVMRDHLTVEGVDAWFVEYFRDDAELSALRNRLLKSKPLQYWKPLVEQMFREYERGDFAICIPALLCVLEGSIAAAWSVAFHNEKDRRRFFNRKIEAERRGSVLYYLWKSVAAFINTIFETGVSDRHEHPVPKRHLILHGKSDPAKWDQADCLRLFQAIDSVLSLHRFRRSRSHST